MDTKTSHPGRTALGIVLVLLLLAALSAPVLLRQTPEEEMKIRESVVRCAEAYLGRGEADESHREIIDRYNTLDPLPRSYAVRYEDSWCATFVSVVMMDAGLEEDVPLECGCQAMIDLYQAAGQWEESDWYWPRVGDVIFYAWDERLIGECTGWADHVGIVAGVYGPVLKVIEGNKDDAVAYRYIWVGHPWIRGYGLPDYAAFTEPEESMGPVNNAG